MSNKSLCAAVALTAAFALLAAGSATAGTYTATALVQTSVNPSPFASCTIGGPGTNYSGAEVEPWVSVDPTNPDNIVGVFQQDRWADGGARGLVAAVSHNGGTTWTETWAHFSRCAGGTVANGGYYERATDPWDSFAPNGDLYQISYSFNESDVKQAILVSKSINAGDTWSEPTTLILDNDPTVFDDKESITADPNDSNDVYAVWDRGRLPSDKAGPEAAIHSFAFRSDIMFSETTNGGTSWSTARAIFHPKSNLFSIGNQIAVEPDGTLVDVFALTQGSGIQPNGNSKASIAVIRSTDGGATWSDPIIVGQNVPVGVVDPETGAPLRTGSGLPDIAVDMDGASPGFGNLYVVWQSAQLSGKSHGRFNFDQILLSKSTDGGQTWSDPVVVNQTPGGGPAFTPSVDVASDGVVGITYYDFRNNTVASGLLTDYFLIHSHNQGATWSETPVTTTSFDVEFAPNARGLFLGDYEGLDHGGTLGNKFVPLFVQTNNSTTNRTDVFQDYVGP